MSAHAALFWSGSLALLAVAAAGLWQPLRRHSRAWPFGLTVALAAFTAVVYAHIGHPGALKPGATQAQPPSIAAPPVAASSAPAPNMTQAQIEAMVERLAGRLDKEPNDLDGWRMLVRSYETLGRFDEAVLAWQRVFALAPPDADQLVDYAVTLGMARDQTLAGEPEAVIGRALQLEPDHLQALALAGSAAFERRDYAVAVSRWERILSLVPPGADLRAGIEASIAKAERLARQDGAKAVSP